MLVSQDGELEDFCLHMRVYYVLDETANLTQNWKWGVSDCEVQVIRSLE